VQITHFGRAGRLAQALALCGSYSAACEKMGRPSSPWLRSARNHRCIVASAYRTAIEQAERKQAIVSGKTGIDFGGQRVPAT